tara:strand:+ start:3058 stop:3399 length:342 start_codon:yes stop_codon:yes gene_type:complete
VKSLSDIILGLSERWEWFDDLVDLIWRGAAYHIVVLAHSSDSPDIDSYCEWLGEQGPWTVELVFSDSKNYCTPGYFDTVDFRGWSLLRWTNSQNITRWHRSGYSFEPVTTLEA